MTFKSIFGAVCTCLAVFSLNVNAIPMYDYNGGGEITGISGLEVDGNVWDMTLHNASFDDLFVVSGADAISDGGFTFLASIAMVDFTNSQSDISGSDLVGCTVSDCLIMSVHEYNGSLISGVGDVIRFGAPDITLGGTVSSSTNFASITIATWAESASVPEPSIAILMASGLIAFGVVRRKSRV